MLQFLRRILKRRNAPLNIFHISKNALLNNIDTLRALHPDDGLFPVIKSNAYGHGLAQIATILDETTCEYLCVDSQPEYAIAKKHTSKDFLVLSETNAQNYKLYDWKRTTFVVSSFSTLSYFVERNKPVTVHIFINTGLNREWFSEAQMPELISILQGAKHIDVEWIMSHLSHADNIDPSYTQKQIDRFKTMHNEFIQGWYAPLYRHIGASAGTFTIQDPFFTAWRVGKSMYWYSPLPTNHLSYNQTTDLEPIASITSTVLDIRTIQAWETVWYSGTRTAPQESTIALIPFGYFEWLLRRLSNKWSVQRKWIYLPLVGNISMNYCSVDVTGHDVQPWDIVELFSPDPSAPNHITKATALLGDIINYEVLTHWNDSIKRVIEKW